MAHRPFMLEPGHLDQIPVGWEIRVLGLVTGPPMEVAYDPDRHDVLIVAGDSLERLGRQPTDAGWERLGPYTDGEVWARDRVAATQAALARQSASAVPGRARPTRSAVVDGQAQAPVSPDRAAVQPPAALDPPSNPWAASGEPRGPTGGFTATTLGGLGERRAAPLPVPNRDVEENIVSHSWWTLAERDDRDYASDRYSRYGPTSPPGSSGPWLTTRFGMRSAGRRGAGGSPPTR